MTKRVRVLEFEWDKGNIEKSVSRHGVTPKEAEEVFFDEELGVIPDIKHSLEEKRFIALGKTFERENLFVVFAIRDHKIRVMKKLKRIPNFKSENDERKFWQKVDTTKYVDFGQMEHWAFPDLKLSSKPITIRIPESILDRVKIKANKMDMPYQSLIKQFIFRGLGMI